MPFHARYQHGRLSHLSIHTHHKSLLTITNYTKEFHPNRNIDIRPPCIQTHHHIPDIIFASPILFLLTIDKSLKILTTQHTHAILIRTNQFRSMWNTTKICDVPHTSSLVLNYHVALFRLALSQLHFSDFLRNHFLVQSSLIH